MGKPLVPELHDVGKLFHIDEQLAQQLNLNQGSLHPHNIALLPQRLGIPAPSTRTWQGIVGHHVPRGALPQDEEMCLLIVADHSVSSLARVYEETDLERVKPVHRTVHKLWNTGDQRELRLPGMEEDLRALVEWLSRDPDQDEFLRRYGDLLNERPEQLKPPLNVTSLASHSLIAGKVYRFLTARRELYARTAAPKDIENRPIELVKARIIFPHSVVRTRDMALFAVMEKRIRDLASDDRVLVATFDEVLAILAPGEGVESLFAPLTDEGFHVVWERARTEVGDLASTPARIREKRKQELRQGSEKIPADLRARWVWEKLDQDYSAGVLTPHLEDRFSPPICDVCQMERASRVWPDAPDAPGPRENIGERCYALRQNAPRLFKLDRWTDEPSARVAWIYVGLDLERLVGFLYSLYRNYARDVGLAPERVDLVDVRPPLIAEFQKDYCKFLADFATSVETWAGDENLERVGGETAESANTLLCARLESVAQIPDLLRLFLDNVRRYFPVMLERATAADQNPVQPFRLAVSVSGVKFPFSEHWRMMQEETVDVFVNVIGRRPVRAHLASLPILIEAGRPGHRTALHNLAEVAKVSEALAEVYAQNKGEKHYNEYQDIISKMRPLGMTYESLVAYANLLEG